MGSVHHVQLDDTSKMRGVGRARVTRRVDGSSYKSTLKLLSAVAGRTPSSDLLSGAGRRDGLRSNLKVDEFHSGVDCSSGDWQPSV